MSVTTVLARIKADTSDFAAKMSGAQSQMETFSKKASDVGKKLSFSVTAPIVGTGAVALKMAMDFDKSMSQIQGLVGVAADEVDQMRGSVRNLASAYGSTASEAAQAMFYITSAGLRGADATEVLEYALKASAAGLGEVKTVADLATSAMNAYGPEVLSASHATDILTAAVREGKLEPAELSGAMGAVLPVASAMGVGFEQVGAAMAAMSRTGTGASEAATQLNGILSGLLKPTQQAEEVLEGLGMSSAGLRQKIKDDGLLSTLQLLKERFDGNDDAAAAVFGNVRALRGVLDMMGASADTTAGIFASLENAVGMTDEAFGVTSETASFKMQQAFNSMRGSLIEFGNLLMPFAVRFAEMLSSVADRFKALGPGVKQAIAVVSVALASVGPIIWGMGKAVKAVAWLVKPFTGAIKMLSNAFFLLKNPIFAVRYAWMALSASFLASPLGLIIAGIVALVAALVVAYNKIPAFREAVQAAFERVREIIAGVVDFIKPILTNVWEGIKSAVQTVWPVVQAVFSGIWTAIKTYLGFVWGYIKFVFGVASTIVRALWPVVKAVFGGIWTVIKSVFDAVWPAVKGAFDNVKNVIVGVVDTVKNIFGGLFGGGEAAAGASGFMDTLKNVFSTVQSVIIKFGEKVAPIVSGVFGVIASVVSTVLPVVLSIVGRVFGLIRNIITVAMTVIGAVVKTAWNVIAAVVRFGVNYIWPVIRGAFQMIWGVVSAIMSAVVGVIRTAWNVISAVIGFAMDYIWPVIKTVFTNIFSFISSTMKIVWGVIETVWSVIRAIVVVAVTLIWNAVKSYFTMLWNIVTTIMQGVWAVIKWVWDEIVMKIVGAVQAVWEKASAGFEQIRSVVSEKMEDAKQIISDVWNWVTGLWDDTIGKLITRSADGFGVIKDKIGEALDKAKALFTDAVDRIGAIWDTVTEKVKQPIRDMFSWINNNMIDPINEVLGKFGDNIAIKRLPAFADGGEVRGRGTTTSDSILARLSNREFVVKAKYAQENLPLLRAMNAGKPLPGTDFVPESMLMPVPVPMGGIGDFARGVIDKAGGAIAGVTDAISGLVAKGASFAAGAILDPALSFLDNTFGGTWGADVVIGTMRSFVDRVKNWGKDQDKLAVAAGGYLGPVSGEWQKPMSAYTVTSEFGPRGGAMHEGIDIAVPGIGAAIYAAAAGKVMRAGWNGGYGNFVAIDHGQGISTEYGHMQTVLARIGQIVQRGQKIGTQGSTGFSTGPHLHFNTLVNGSYVNPRSFMAARGLTFDRGGWLPTGQSTVYNGTGGPEAILTASQWDGVTSLADRVKETLTFFRQAGAGATLSNAMGGGGPYDLDWATFWKGAEQEGDFQEWASKLQLTALNVASDSLDRFRDAVVKLSEDAFKGAKDFARLSEVAPGSGRGWDIDTTIAGLLQRVERVQNFSDALASLQEAGLSQAAFADLVGLGPEAGLAAAQAFLAGADRIGELNKVYEDIERTATEYGDTAAGVQTGRTATAVAGLRETTINMEPGAVVLNFGPGTNAGDREAIRKEVDEALRDAMAELAREINRSR